jgi:1-deoxy-D-xylulose-5-phosphate reductoisomerase
MSHSAAERKLAVLGSTGSIGVATLEVVECLQRNDPAGGWQITALSTHSRVDDLCRQAERVKPRYAIVSGGEVTPEQRRRLEAAGAEVLVGAEALVRVAGSQETGGTVVGAVVGAAGLPSTVAAVKAGKRVALANKESLVVAGSVVMPLAKQTGAKVLPVDSEHSAIFQAMACGRRSEVRRAVLTASGGPFRNVAREKMERATVEEALNHPTWRMGGKITIDSATLFNKAFEMIEAKWLFDLQVNEIGVVVHPQSVIHSMVEFVDGSVMAQLSPPDMKLPIQFALTWPDRCACPGPKMDWTKSASLTFEPVDREKFPAIGMAEEVIHEDGCLGAVMNAANEVAVGAFLQGGGGGGVAFGEITRTVREVIDRGTGRSWGAGLSGLMEADEWARREAESVLSRRRVVIGV